MSVSSVWLNYWKDCPTGVWGHFIISHRPWIGSPFAEMPLSGLSMIGCCLLCFGSSSFGQVESNVSRAPHHLQNEFRLFSVPLSPIQIAGVVHNPPQSLTGILNETESVKFLYRHFLILFSQLNKTAELLFQLGDRNLY